MKTLYLHLFLSSFRFNSLYPKPSRRFFCFFFPLSSQAHTNTTTPSSNPLLFNYLIETIAFSEPQALSISNRFPGIKTLDKPQSVVQFLKQLGFSDIQIRSSIRVAPRILFLDIDKNLKPKLQFFQDQGLTGPHLCKFVSKNSSFLNHSLEKRLIPSVDIIKKTLINDKNNQDFIRVLRMFSWVASNNSELRLLRNISFLESCGIVGSQLSTLLKKKPRLFVMRESALRDLISRVLDMGFRIDSRMLVHAVFTVSCISGETFSRKLELFRSFGFSEDEFMEMFRSTPLLLGTSEEKLKIAVEFFLNDIKFERSVLVRRPTCLMLSMEKRVIPRYRVLQVMKSKRLLKKEPCLVTVVRLSEARFQEKFISRFRDDAEELLVVYKGHLLGSSGE